MTPQSPGVPFRSDGDIAIHVPDLAKAEDFYANVLGFPLVDRTPELLHFDTGALQLYIRQDAQTLLPFIPALEVPDYARAREHLERSGCRIIHEWEGGKALYFQDPFGLVIDIVEKAPARKGAPKSNRRALRKVRRTKRRPRR
ncbi:MAG TPA: VOC family protein [Bacteroidota bacterium]|nr:VOC family protein [Bacteroidota bacterium]